MTEAHKIPKKQLPVFEDLLDLNEPHDLEEIARIPNHLTQEIEDRVRAWTEDELVHFWLLCHRQEAIWIIGIDDLHPQRKALMLRLCKNLLRDRWNFALSDSDEIHPKQSDHARLIQ